MISLISTRESTQSLLQELSPFLLHAGLIRSTDDGESVITALGSYELGEDPADVIIQASHELEAELPRLYNLRVDGDDITILERAVGDDGVEVLRPIGTDLDSDDIDLLNEVISAQGGSFKRYGNFRLDLRLADQRLFNCSHCGEVWKSSKESPKRCPRCRSEMPRSDKRSKMAPPQKYFRDETMAVNGTIFQDVEHQRLFHDIVQNYNSMDLMNHMDYKQDFLSYGHRETPYAERLLESLQSLSAEYDAETLNMVRSKELNADIIMMLKGAERNIQKILETQYPPNVIKVQSVRPIGNWPHTAWISFNMNPKSLPAEGIVSRYNLACMLLKEVEGQRWALCIVPNVKDLIGSHGHEWRSVLSNLRSEVILELDDPRFKGFILGEEADLRAEPDSPGSRMLEAVLLHRVIDVLTEEPAHLKESILMAMEAYSKLI